MSTSERKRGAEWLKTREEKAGAGGKGGASQRKVLRGTGVAEEGGTGRRVPRGAAASPGLRGGVPGDCVARPSE